MSQARTGIDPTMHGGKRPSEVLFRMVCLAAVIGPLLILGWLLGQILIDGLGRLDLEFIRSYPSRRAARAGIWPGLIGSLYLVGLTGLIALPLGVGAAIYLEEYARKGRLANLIEVNLANLAGVPSVIYGLLGLGVFVRFAGLGRSLLAGAATLALLVLPIVVVASREALRTIPNHIREASYALGSTKWRTVRGVVLPMALPGILTGAILSISRAIGETAPLIVVGAVTYITFLPSGIVGEDAQFTALPLQIYNWTSRPQKAFEINAAAGIVVLLATMLILNLSAIVIRNKFQKKY